MWQYNRSMAISIDCAFIGCSIHAACIAADHIRPPTGQVASHIVGKSQALLARVARTDNCNRLPLQNAQIANVKKYWWCLVAFKCSLQKPGILPVKDSEERDRSIRQLLNQE